MAREPTTDDRDGSVQLVAADLKGEPQPHEAGGWPEFVIELRYIVRSDDGAVQEEQARATFTAIDRLDELFAPVPPRTRGSSDSGEPA